MLLTLAPETTEQYGKMWGLWGVFICRMYRLLQEGDTRYPIRMTPKQIKAVEVALKYCSGDANRRSANYAVTNLARRFWHPDNPEEFDPIAENQFSDLTNRFLVLSNLRKDGTFEDPRDAAHNCVEMKYIMRSALLQWSRRDHQAKKKSIQT